MTHLGLWHWHCGTRKHFSVLSRAYDNSPGGFPTIKVDGAELVRVKRGVEVVNGGCIVCGEGERGGKIVNQRRTIKSLGGSRSRNV